MIEWDKWLSWQAQVTDAIDREEQEIHIYRTMEKMLLARREQAIQLDRIAELSEIESHLAYIHLTVKMKTLLIKQWEAQFKLAAQALIN